MDAGVFVPLLRLLINCYVPTQSRAYNNVKIYLIKPTETDYFEKGHSVKL